MADQDTFDLQRFLPYLLNQAAEASSLDFQSVYKSRYGMLRNEWRVLFHLGMYGRLTASDIRDRSHLELTPQGQAAYRDLRKIAKDYDEALAEMLGDEDVAALRRMLLRLAQRVS